VTKVVLREAMRGIVPERVLQRKDKLAYSPPQERWLRGPLRSWMRDLLVAAERRTEFFSARHVLDVRETLDRTTGSPLAWRIASTEAWFQLMVDSSRNTPAPSAEISGMNW